MIAGSARHPAPIEAHPSAKCENWVSIGNVDAPSHVKKNTVRMPQGHRSSCWGPPQARNESRVHGPSAGGAGEWSILPPSHRVRSCPHPPTASLCICGMRVLKVKKKKTEEEAMYLRRKRRAGKKQMASTTILRNFRSPKPSPRLLSVARATNSSTLPQGRLSRLRANVNFMNRTRSRQRSPFAHSE